MLRLKSKKDRLLSLLGEGTKDILDCTMGLASDSIVMASGGHRVTALESSPWIHLIISQGLQEFDSGNVELNQAMRSIQTYCRDSLSFLAEQADASFDILYFDPMFSAEITESKNLASLKSVADYTPLTQQLLIEAKRVAREKIILKAHFKDSRMEALGFERHIRPNQKFHYGEMILEEKGR